MGALPWVVFYSAGSGVNRVQVVLSGLSVRFFVLSMHILCRHGCMYLLVALVLVYVDVIVMSSAQAMIGTGALGGGMSAV